MRTLHIISAATALTGLASAQGFNNQWAEFALDTGQPFTPTSISNQQTEVDFYAGDLDKNGYDDVVVVRKEPFTSPGKRTNVLLMNYGGQLLDQTLIYANLSDVPDDRGFGTPTNDRDVVVFDLDNDGWLDVVTATTISDGDPKHIGHPRVYMNLGDDGAGNWLGLEHQDARIPQLFHFGTGNPENPRFCSVSAGDVTGDGFADLYFGDYDSSGAGGTQQPSNKDLNDRLLINDGNGYFTDESQSRMGTQALLSAFGTEVEIADFNGDGVNDIAKDTALNAPQYVAISYNDPNNPGQFPPVFFDDFHVGFAPYHIDAGDLNADGRIDLIFSDDGNDRFRINQGNDPFGRVIWSEAKTYSFLAGGDDGFGSNNLIADLNGDGYNDVLITDVDVDIGGFGRRLHIYHNVTVQAGTETFVEERQSSGGGWVGVVGMTENDMRGSHDVLVFDMDKDGDNDMFLGRADGTFVWENLADPVLCQSDLGSAGPGAMTLALCGQPLYQGNTSTLSISGGASGAPAALVVGSSQSPMPLLGGTLLPSIEVVGELTLDGLGGVSLPITAGAGAATFYAQVIAIDLGLPELFSFSNAIEILFNQG
ncbi:FG-GAP repeat domain-containing protein [Engelhardtia mirabilis]|uniref:FG-GAP repeat protein n=1 Tax=Engelhardtia mirabilis TaxID=2528011 RepID=A0A518BR09_9BACT|nr:FG-GAP repeat protein [Planctomycetes bacterium Pla133]QDV03735.1 FG-GAP repeat protein [Planctomycetes bacterium Pla86]